jgi:hypothetical protein
VTRPTDPPARYDDSRAVINLVNRIFIAADARDWDTYRSLMLDEIRVDFAGIGPHQPGSAAADDLTHNTRAALGPVSLTQHMLTNHVVDIDGDHAHVTFYEHALHHHPALGDDPQVNTWSLFARATRDAIRTDRGWRIGGAGLSVVHQIGNRDLLAAVAALNPNPGPPDRPATDSMNSTDSTKDLTVMTQPADASDVLTVLHSYFSAADARDWDAYRAVHADRIEVDFGGINDDNDGSVGADDMLHSARTLLDPVHLTQHMISSEVVSVDGDQAKVTFYEEALHHHPALGDDPRVNTWVLYGRGEHRLRRTADGWKLVAAALVPVHQTGNAHLLADIAAAPSSARGSADIARPIDR